MENSVAVWQNLSGCLGGLDNLIIYLLKNCHLLSKKIVSIFTFWFYFHIFENKIVPIPKAMKHIYKGPGLFFLAIIVIFSGCSKDSYYPVDNAIKPFFVFQPGSYWIYSNDSTGSIDSVWVSSNRSSISDFDNTTISTEIITVNLKGSFLESIQLMGQPHGTSSSVFISTWVFDDSTGSNSLSILPGFFTDCQIVSQYNQDTSKTGLFANFMFILSDTINNLPLKDILYNNIRSKDSSATNSRFLTREIWIVKNVGIIKIIEKYRYFNIDRSYSLLRYHVIQ